MMESPAFAVWEYSAIIIALVLVSKLIAKKTRTVDVLWLIFAGALLTNLGWLPLHNEFLETLGEWGIVFIMFALGLEEDIHRFTQGIKRGIGIALIGAAFPFIGAFTTAKWFGYDTPAALIWGLTMTATAVSLTMMSLRSDLLHKSTAATGIMTAAIIDDVLSLVGVAILVPLLLVSSPGEAIGIVGVLWVLLKVILFFTITLFMGLVAFPERSPRVLPPQSSWYQRLDHQFSRVLAKFGVRKLLMIHSGEFAPLVMIFIALQLGVIAHWLGFHPAIGAYFAGLFLHADYFVYTKTVSDVNEEGEKFTRKEKDHQFERTKAVIEHIAFTIFGPIFFINLGGKLQFDINIVVSALPAAIVLYLVVVLFQVLSAGLAAKYTGKYHWHESVMIGLGMLGRAELAFIVINIAFVQNKMIDATQFYVLMFVTFMLNITVPLSLRAWKPFYLGFKDCSIFNLKLSRSTLAEMTPDMAEYRDQIEVERSWYNKQAMDKKQMGKITSIKNNPNHPTK